MKIRKGLATWAGLVAAAGQYLGAVAIFLTADDQALAIAPLVTATGVLWKVIEGRMNQATAAIAANPPAALPVAGELGEPENLALEVPAGSLIQDGQRP